jgi:hypothetical protein
MSGRSPSGRAGRSATGAGSRLRHSATIPNASRFIGWIADRFQERHTPPLPRDDALAMAVHTLEWVEEDTPFGDPRFDWGQEGARAVADEEISYWETPSAAA